MIKNLVKVANRLDSLGLTKEADTLDAIIRKLSAEADPTRLVDTSMRETLSSDTPAAPDPLQNVVSYLSESYPLRPTPQVWLIPDLVILQLHQILFKTLSLI